MIIHSLECSCFVWWLWWLWFGRHLDVTRVWPSITTLAPKYGGHVPVDMTPTGAAPVCRAKKKPPLDSRHKHGENRPRRQTTECECAILAHKNATAHQRALLANQHTCYAADVGHLFSWARHGCGLLREALHVRDAEGISQARHGAQEDVGTLSPATITTIKTVRASGKRATRDLLKRSTRNPPEVSTNCDSTAWVPENARPCFMTEREREVVLQTQPN